MSFKEEEGLTALYYFDMWILYLLEIPEKLRLLVPGNAQIKP
jgi:hypothetical protein